jgi:hypothetical protein
MRALTMDEVQVVSGGLSKEEAGVISGVFAAGAALTGSFALVPGPHTPVAGFISGAMAFGSAMFGLYAVGGSIERTSI